MFFVCYKKPFMWSELVFICFVSSLYEFLFPLSSRLVKELYAADWHLCVQTQQWSGHWTGETPVSAIIDDLFHFRYLSFHPAERVWSATSYMCEHAFINDQKKEVPNLHFVYFTKNRNEELDTLPNTPSTFLSNGVLVFSCSNLLMRSHRWPAEPALSAAALAASRAAS